MTTPENAHIPKEQLVAWLAAEERMEHFFAWVRRHREWTATPEDPCSCILAQYVNWNTGWAVQVQPQSISTMDHSVESPTTDWQAGVIEAFDSLRGSDNGEASFEAFLEEWDRRVDDNAQIMRAIEERGA